MIAWGAGTLGRRGLGVALGLLLDRLVGEPPSAVHPVVWFGKSMERAEDVLWADRRSHGIAYAAIGVGLGVVAGWLGRSTVAAVAITVAGRELRTTAERVGRATTSGDLDRARGELPSLVGRDPSELDGSQIAAAVIESVAENSVDAVIAPIFWAVIAGPSGAGAYRAINTMDAMVGHRNDRYRNFGWAAARIDDVANYVPARIYAGLVAVQTPRRATEILATAWRDAPAHPSPNAGVAESAVAAALGRELGGPLRYGDRVESRPMLGTGPRPTPADIPRAIAIANRTELTAVGVLSLAWLIHAIRRSS